MGRELLKAQELSKVELMSDGKFPYSRFVLYNCPECNSRFMTKKGLKTHIH